MVDGVLGSLRLNRSLAGGGVFDFLDRAFDLFKFLLLFGSAGLNRRQEVIR
jgi:hypothetical protein